MKKLWRWLFGFISFLTLAPYFLWVMLHLLGPYWQQLEVMRRVTRGFQLAKQQAASIALDTRLHEGDLIFHTSLSAQSQAIQLATHSPYSHCGLLYKTNGEWQVFEAVQPVKLTPLAR